MLSWNCSRSAADTDINCQSPLQLFVYCYKKFDRTQFSNFLKLQTQGFVVLHNQELTVFYQHSTGRGFLFKWQR